MITGSALPLRWLLRWFVELAQSVEISLPDESQNFS
jgi:hypothetical protein